LRYRSAAADGESVGSDAEVGMVGAEEASEATEVAAEEEE